MYELYHTHQVILKLHPAVYPSKGKIMTSNNEISTLSSITMLKVVVLLKSINAGELYEVIIIDISRGGIVLSVTINSRILAIKHYTDMILIHNVSE